MAAISWQKVQECLEERIDGNIYRIWVKPVDYKGMEESEIVLSVPSPLYIEKLKTQWTDWIREEVFHQTNQHFKIRFEIRQPDESSSVHKNDSLDKTADSVSGSSPALTLIQSNGDGRSSAMSRLRFENFAVGPSNEAAYTTAMDIVQEKLPGCPVVFLGQSAVGKTHLLRAISREIASSGGTRRVKYVTAEQFLNEFVMGFRNSSQNLFRQKYREKVDVLLIDDIQFYSGKKGVQEEFLNTLSHLCGAGKHVVITSDKYPEDIKEFSDALRSRLQGGIVIEVLPPEVELREEIIAKKANDAGLDLSEDVRAFMASNITGNVRKLEGAVNRLRVYSRQGPLTLERVRLILKRSLNGIGQGPLAVEKIAGAVARYYGVQVKELYSKARRKPVAYPRQIGMYLARELTGVSLAQIGELFGGKHYSSVHHSIKKVEALIARDLYLQGEITEIKSNL